MLDNTIFGIDCGATKVMAQSAFYDKKSNLITPGKENLEFNYSDSINWDSYFTPKSIETQKKELDYGQIKIARDEKKQAEVIVKTIALVLSKIKSKNYGICYPGIKNDKGIILMANGPRIVDFFKQFPMIKSLYDDSYCCLMGEINSSIGKIKNQKNIMYIGGGTGIADGIIMDSKVINIDEYPSLKKSWQILVNSRDTIESYLSPKGILQKWNEKSTDKIYSLFDLEKVPESFPLFKDASEAFAKLIKTRIKFFKNHSYDLKKVIIGQRLGVFLKTCKPHIRDLFQMKSEIPIDYSSDRRVAALGAAWIKVCSQK